MKRPPSSPGHYVEQTTVLSFVLTWRHTPAGSAACASAPSCTEEVSRCRQRAGPPPTYSRQRCSISVRLMPAWKAAANAFDEAP